MIKKFIDRLLGKSPAPEAPAAPPAIPLGQRVEIPAEEHRIDPRLLDDNAVRVVRTLKDAGHEAYIVGGAVRDLLVGLRPKDFDVATDATPEQVKALFRRAFIIGRRFRLVHVIFGRGREHEVIEVSTFRAFMDPAAAEAVSGNEKTARHEIADQRRVVDASGRVLRDNVWGPQIEDAARRDFTINALYYDPTTQIVVDYHGGLADSRARVLRMIGDPEARYREDPVRIVRVVRIAAKLGFEVEPATRAPMRRMAALLANVPPSRMFDEMVKLLQTGHALKSLAELKKQGLDQGVFPVLDAAFRADARHPKRDEFIRFALEDTDARVNDGRAVVPSFMLAVMLWHDVLDRWAAIQAGGEAPFPALQQAVDAVFDARIGDISGRGKLGGDMREIWLMQPRFERRTPAAARALVAQARFRAGYDFLRLRADVGEIEPALAEWWEDFHLGDDDEREAMLVELRPASKRVHRVPAGSTVAAAAAATPAPAEAADDDAAPADAEAAPAKKRRRRRRRPAGGSAPAAPAAGE
ncbi:polynucleotide adenylyltransferase PcnB [Rubrivivax gelatinosus]|uniref:polynucleotide adenylyltransferase PcnB n=1 Tax=Rubrivivax gelatinosus TaxID=28068 RepID=UPI003A80AF82